MESLPRTVRKRLDSVVADHLQRLMMSWQLIADLAFADLLLFVRVEGIAGFQIVGQLRPYTARTLYPSDLVGEIVEPSWHPYVERAFREGRRLRSPEPVLIDAEPVRVEAVPVRCDGVPERRSSIGDALPSAEVANSATRASRGYSNASLVAVLSVEAAELPDRPTGRLEAAYLRAADALLEMVAASTFPFKQAQDRIASPRVGDGLVSLDGSARVEFASPNATSAFRRMGINALPLGQPLPRRFGTLVAESMAGRVPVESEVELDGSVTDVRVVPLLRGGQRRGALMLVHEVTELRRRDREISRREATIREVHHRVKNNLQTVASLLRLQARRMGDHPMAVEALEESVRRVASIALVHETLTEEFEGAVDMTDVARRVVRMLESSLGREDVRIAVAGSSLRVDAAIATPLAVVMTELVQNGIDHGLRGGPGMVSVRLDGGPEQGTNIELVVTDETPSPRPGRPSPAGGGLGLRLVRALVEEELGGTFTLTHRTDGHGSTARAVVPASGSR